MEFEHYSGPKFFPVGHTKENWIPINPMSVYAKIIGCNRIQYPLRLAYALTIHKSQGQTIEKVVIELGKSVKSLGLTFVAFSRVKHFKDFLVCPFTLERFTKISESASLAARLKEDIRLESLTKKTMRDFNFLLDEELN